MSLKLECLREIMGILSSEDIAGFKNLYHRDWKTDILENTINILIFLIILTTIYSILSLTTATNKRLLRETTLATSYFQFDGKFKIGYFWQKIQKIGGYFLETLRSTFVIWGYTTWQNLKNQYHYLYSLTGKYCGHFQKI